MKSSSLDTPFIWPDPRRMGTSVPGPKPDFDALLAESQLVLGVVQGFTEVGVRRLKTILTETLCPIAPGGTPSSPSTKKVRLIVTLYPTCPTISDVLVALFQLQANHASLEVRIVTCALFGGPEKTLACYRSLDSVPTVLFGSSASLEDVSDDPTHLTLPFSPEPMLATEWQNWFDVKWLKAARLTKERTSIPHLVLLEGTLEAAQRWAAYEQLCVEEQHGEELVEVTVDPTTGEVTAKSPMERRYRRFRRRTICPKCLPSMGSSPNCRHGTSGEHGQNDSTLAVRGTGQTEMVWGGNPETDWFGEMGS